MARGRKTGGRDFGPDNPPPGGKRLTAFEKDVRKRLRTHIGEVCEMLLTDARDVMAKVQDNPTVLELFVGFAIERKDHRFLELMLTRALGKPKQEIEVKAEVAPRSEVDLKVLSTEQLEQIQKVIDG